MSDIYGISDIYKIKLEFGIRRVSNSNSNSNFQMEFESLSRSQSGGQGAQTKTSSAPSGCARDMHFDVSNFKVWA